MESATTEEEHVTGRIYDARQSFRSSLNGTGSCEKCKVSPPQDIVAVKEYTISFGERGESASCWITGSVRIDGNTLAVADQDDKAVKLVDLNRRQVKLCLYVKQEPYDITRIDEHTLAVTCPFGECIQLLRLSKSGYLALDRQIHVEGACCGIRYIDIDSGRLVVSFLYPHKVKVMDMSGTVLKDLSSDTIGRPRFSLPSLVTSSNNGRTIIVSNYGTGTVSGLTLDGEVKFVYWDDELVSPYGLAVGDEEEIYVCGNASNNIHVLSGEGRKVKILLREGDGVYHPECITYSDNKLFIGSENGNVDVYRLKKQ